MGSVLIKESLKEVAFAVVADEEKDRFLLPCMRPYRAGFRRYRREKGDICDLSKRTMHLQLIKDGFCGNALFRIFGAFFDGSLRNFFFF